MNNSGASFVRVNSVIRDEVSSASEIIFVFVKFVVIVVNFSFDIEEAVNSITTLASYVLTGPFNGSKQPGLTF